MQNSQCIVNLKNVTRAFGGLLAVRNVDLEIHEGEIRGLIGPNGAGKTTLLNLISGIIKPTSGEIWILGKRTRNLPPWAVTRLGVARTFQQVRLIEHLTVLENVLWALMHKANYRLTDVLLQTPRYIRGEMRDREAAESLLEYLELSEYKYYLASDLPYGLQRRLEVARALALKPKVLLLDEPTAGLTMGEALDFARFLKALQEKSGLTIIIIEHNMRVVMEVCRFITVMNEGEVICEGCPDEVRMNKQVVEAYLGKGHHVIN